MTKYYRLGDLKQQTFFPLQWWKLGRSRSRCQQIWFPMRALSGLQKSAFLLCPHIAERETDGDRDSEKDGLRDSEKDTETAHTLISHCFLINTLIPSWGPHPHGLF